MKEDKSEWAFPITSFLDLVIGLKNEKNKGGFERFKRNKIMQL